METHDIIIVCLFFYGAGVSFWAALLDGQVFDLKGSNKRLKNKLNALQEKLDGA